MAKLGVAVYGVVSYLIFLATFVYVIGFVIDFGVAKSVNDGPAMAWPLALLINLGLLGLFALQHTVMARPGFKQMWSKVMPQAGERSTFVLASSIALILLCLFWVPLQGMLWSVSEPWLRTALWVGCAVGWGLALVSTFLIDHFSLFGLRQIWNHLRSNPEQTTIEFRTPFLYRWMRHPMMTGFFIAFWVMPDMSLNQALLAAGFSIYIVLGTMHEERGLIREFGDQYRAYINSTPRFFPGLKF